MTFVLSRSTHHKRYISSAQIDITASVTSPLLQFRTHATSVFGVLKMPDTHTISSHKFRVLKMPDTWYTILVIWTDVWQWLSYCHDRHTINDTLVLPKLTSLQASHPHCFNFVLARHPFLYSRMCHISYHIECHRFTTIIPRSDSRQ